MIKKRREKMEDINSRKRKKKRGIKISKKKDNLLLRTYLKKIL